nr:reverse transcriptase domain-containing protein [Tanacetum cinerariifolium]
MANPLLNNGVNLPEDEQIKEGELPPPPADSDTSSDSEPEVEAEDEDGDKATVGTITRASYSIPPFSGTVYVGSGSSHKVFAPGLIGDNVDMLQRKVKGLSQQMFDRANTEYSTLKRLGEMDRYLSGLSTKRRSEVREHYKLKQSRFHELVLLCPEAVPTEKKKVEAYIKGFPKNIKGETTSSRPVNMNEVVRMAHTLMEQKVQAKAERVSEGNKKKWENSQGGNRNNNNNNRGNYQGNNRHQQYNNQRQGNARALTNAPTEQVEYKGPKPFCNNCHLFNIDLMPIELGTFDVIIGMDWLVEQDAVIMCGKKVVHVPYKNKTLVVEGDRGASRLKFISCIKARKFIERGSQLFVAHVTEKEPQEKRIEDVHVIRDFLEVFPDDLSGLPPPRQVKFRIDLAPGVAPVTRAPYRLAPSEMKELAKQL